MANWTTADIPDQTGRVFVVTGASSGLGLEATRALAEKGGYVVMACRNLDKAQAARESLGAGLQERTEVRRLDLGDRSSVHAFADELHDWRIDVLINNAGVMVPPQGTTADGHELQWGTNVLGHFALTARLLPQVTDRVVWLSSIAHRRGSIDLADPDWKQRRYNAWQAYGQSKLADLVLAHELQRRLTAKGSLVRSVAAHPGYAATELQTRESVGVLARAMPLMNRSRRLAQSAADGALPELFAATVIDLPGGSYIGPGGFGEMAGSPVEVGSSRASRDRELGRALWSLCEQQTGLSFQV